MENTIIHWTNLPYDLWNIILSFVSSPNNSPEGHIPGDHRNLNLYIVFLTSTAMSCHYNEKETKENLKEQMLIQSRIRFKNMLGSATILPNGKLHCMTGPALILKDYELYAKDGFLIEEYGKLCLFSFTNMNYNRTNRTRPLLRDYICSADLTIFIKFGLSVFQNHMITCTVTCTHNVYIKTDIKSLFSKQKEDALLT